MKFEGVYTAMVTPLSTDGEIDEKALRALVDFQIDEGIDGLLPMGTTGESPTLDHDEHIRVIEIVVEQAAGRVPVVAGAGSNSTREAINLTRRAQKAGIDASLQVAPYYNKPSQEGFYRHFTAIADAVDLPMMIYNIPGRTGKNIENPTMVRMAEHTNIQAVKEASGSIPQVMNLIAEKPEGFAVLSGDDNLGFPIMCLGGKGIVSVASNIIPGRMSRFAASLLEGDLEGARKEFYHLLPLFRAMFFDTNPIPVKYAVSAMGMMNESYRLPLCSMNDENKGKVDDILRDLGLL